MTVTILSQTAVQAGHRPAVSRLERVLGEIVERIDARGPNSRKTIRVDLCGLTLRQIRITRRALKSKHWAARVFADQNDGKTYMLIN